jgi:hypothetical protein
MSAADARTDFAASLIGTSTGATSLNNASLPPLVAVARTRKSASSSPKRVSAALEKHLAAYAAAGIAGACLLNATPDAEAKVIYTPAHVVIDLGSKFDLDVNGDGVIDFVFSNAGSTFIELFAVMPQHHSNAVVNDGLCFSSNFLPRQAPAALPAGQEIGKQLKFGAYGNCMRSFFYYDTQGHWQHATNQYLGLAMRIDGQIHYGWARLSTRGILNFQGLLTGYAYETVAGKSIVAGDEGQDAQNARPIEPPNNMKSDRTLGDLAVGAARPTP